MISPYSPLVPAVACLRSVATVLSAVLTWVTIWHFSTTPFPLFYGWLFNLIALTLVASLALTCNHLSTQLVQLVWAWGSRGNLQLNNIVAVNSSLGAVCPKQPASQHHTQLLSQQTCSFRTWMLGLLKYLAVIVVLLLLLLAMLVLHAGAVVADWQLIACWQRLRAARGKPSRRALKQQLNDAQHAATEASVLLALLFVVPSVSIKWALIMLTGDFSIIPLSSCTVSILSSIATISGFCSHTFIACSVWTLRQRVLGILCVVMCISGQCLWRLAAYAWLIVKFGGEAAAIWLYVCQLTVAVSVVARSTASRQAYLECFNSNKIPVALVTLTGACIVAFDFPALFHGLKSRQAARWPAWLKQLLLSQSVTSLILWRLVEGVVGYTLIMALHPLPACRRQPEHFSNLRDVCSVVAYQTRYIWRPKCWGCSIFDMLVWPGDGATSSTDLLVPALMWGLAGLLMLLMLVGYAGARLLLSRVLPQQPLASSKTTSGAVVSSSASFGSALPCATQPTPLTSPQSLAPPPTAATAAVVLPSSASAASQATCSILLTSVLGDVGSADGTVGPASCVVDMNGCNSCCPIPQHLHALQPMGPCNLPAVQRCCQQLPAAVHGTSGMVEEVGWPLVEPGLPQQLPAIQYDDAASGSELTPVQRPAGDVGVGTVQNSCIRGGNVLLAPLQCPWPSVWVLKGMHMRSGAVAAAAAATQRQLGVGLEVLGMVLLVIVSDIIVFNCHFYLQCLVLPGAVMYLLWVHVAFACRAWQEPESQTAAVTILKI